MTFPTIPTVASGRLLTAFDTTPATATFPDLSGLTKNNGDLLIAIVVVYQSTATAGAVFSGWGGGFTEFVDQRGGTTQMSIGAAYKWSTGSETGTFSVTIGATITGHAALILMSIPGAHATTPPEGGTIAVGTTAAADPGALNPAGWDAEDTLWIAVGASGETSLTGSYTGMGLAAGPPTNYGNAVSTGESGDVIGAVAMAVAFRQLNAASEDVGIWSSADLSNARNVALVIAVRPAAMLDSPALELSSFGSFAGVGSGDTINYVRVSMVHKETATGGAPDVQLWDGTTAQIGTTRTGTTGTSDHTDNFDFSGVTYSQLSTLRVRVLAHAPTTITESVDSVSLTVNYTAVAGSDATATPAVVASVSAVPAPTITRTASVALAGAVAAIVAVPAPAVQTAGNATPSPAAVAAVAAVPAPTITRSATVAPSTVAAIASVGSMTGAIATTVDVTAVAAVAATPAPVVQTAGNATPTPAAVAAVAAVPAPTITRSATPTPSAVAAVAAVPAPTITRSATTVQAPVAAVAAVPAPTITRSATPVVSTVPAIAAVPAPSVSASATVLATVVTGVASVPTVTVLAGSGTTVSPSAVPAIAAVPAPTVLRTATAAPATIQSIAAVPAVTITSTALVVPVTIAGVGTVNAPVLLASGTVTPAAIAAVATVPAVVVNTGSSSSSPFYLWNGVTETPLSMSYWNGTTETPLSSFEIA